jgi:hypothetical protein
MQLFGKLDPESVSSLHYPLPSYGLIYFDHLYGQYLTSSKDKLSAWEKTTLDDIAKKDRTAISWHDLYLFDLLLVKVLPIEKLRRKVWSLRARYREVAGIREYDAYLASKPPDLASEGETKSEDIVRADIDFLMSEIYIRYAIEPIRQLERNVLSRNVAYITIIGIFIILLFGLFVFILKNFFTGYKDPIFAGATFVVAMFSGAMGGLISMQQRFESLTNEGDPINNVSQLVYGRLGAVISAITGAVSAVVLFLVFAGDLLSGDLFPKMSMNDKQANDISYSFLNFFQDIGPVSIKDYAKLIVWSFIAGFAERYVPDTLSRFVSKKQMGRETGS